MFFRVFVLVLLIPNLAYSLPTIQQWKTENGVKVLFVAAPELPMVQMSMAFDAAASRDPKGKSGLSSIVSQMLSQGAGIGEKYQNADQLAEAIESIGAEFSQESARDMSIVAMRSLSDEPILQQAADLYALMVASPSFDNDVLERELQRAKVGLARQEQSPGSIASKELFATLYGNHPYGQSPDIDSLSAISSIDAKNFHQRYFVAKNAVLVIVGDVNRLRAEKLANTITAGLNEGEKPPVLEQVKVVEPSNKDVVFDSLQSHIRFGFPALKQNNPDSYALTVGNYILGGSGLIARLAVEIREKRGLSYSVYSYFSPMKEKGPFIVGLQTRNDRRDEAIDVVRNTIKDFVEKGATDEEVLKAKKHITGGFALRISGNGKIANSLLSAAFYDRPLDYLETYIADIEKISADEVRAAIKKYIDVDNLTQVIVGGKI